MRLIDIEPILDAAKLTGKEYVSIDFLKGFEQVDAVPVVRGEWFVTDAYPHRVCCSLCYKTNVPNEESLFERNEYPKFCMWCGAQMEDKTCR